MKNIHEQRENESEKLVRVTYQLIETEYIEEKKKIYELRLLKNESTYENKVRIKESSE